ncbi:MAG: helix-turn-helix transcriptional regulator [Paludibacter sp.]
MERIEVKISWSGNNYCAGSGAVGGVVLSTHKTFEGVKVAFADTFEFHVKGCLADGDQLPDYIQQGNYEFDFKLEMSALLHNLDGIITRAALARKSGINEKQLGHYMTGHRNPRPAQQQKIINAIHNIGQEFLSV